jgi:hypothetical protein
MTLPPKRPPKLPTGPAPTLTATMVYRVLARGAGPQGNRRLPQAAISIADLAALAGCSRATCTRALRTLRRAGWIQAERLTQSGRRGGRLRGRARWELVMPVDAVVVPVRNVGSSSRRLP